MDVGEEKVKFKNENKVVSEYQYIPYYYGLAEYGADKWIAFGTLTHKYDASAKVQLERFKDLMERIGSKNESFGKRLHWVARVEGSDENNKRLHIHFVLGGHKVTDGHKHKMTREEACAFLEKEWPYGKCEVRPYDEAKDGLGYCLKLTDEEQIDRDQVEISPALMSLLKKQVKTREERDPLALKIYDGLKSIGARVWFGDEVPHWRKV